MEFNLKLTLEQINVIVNSLSKEPYNSVYLLIDAIRQQVNQQVQENNQK